ncbi:MAG: PorT family protein [Muribaculaceae bacterium]|nr:PorT family protein [Muribaculaceae bacterium]
MRKTIIALVCMFIAIGSAMAQKTFTFGPKIGVDLTHFWGSGTQLYDGGNYVQMNYQVGLFAEYRAGDVFAIAPEVVFASQGGIMKDTGIPSGMKKFIYTTNYINVPLMIKFYVSEAVSIDFGPQVGFNVYSKSHGKWEDKDDNYKTTDRKKYTNTVDFGLGLGATYNIASDVFVQARYTLGLTKIFKDEEPIKNGNAQIAIGYRF